MSFADELAKLRTTLSVRPHFTATVTITRYMPQDEDDWGDVSDTTTTAETSGALSPMSTKDSLDIHAGREGEANYYKLVLPYAADIRPSDKVTIGGVVYNVEQLSEDHTTAVFKTAIVRRLD